MKHIKKVDFMRMQNVSLFHQSRVHIYVWELEESGANAVFPVQAGGASQAGASDDGVDRAHTRGGEVWLTSV